MPDRFHTAPKSFYQIIYPQISQIYTDLKIFKVIPEYLFLRNIRNLRNLWIMNLDFAVGWGCRSSQNWEKIFILCTDKSQETKRGLDSL